MEEILEETIEQFSEVLSEEILEKLFEEILMPRRTSNAKRNLSRDSCEVIGTIYVEEM